ncbi:MAG TPA: AlkA N-terminal domain-containing protein [Spirochaetia bacterium]|nr:AlkA N-terminal domain-containing protein [Spirochaetia bacterium]
MELHADVCYRVIQARDARYDGKFFTAVTSTGVYCRPICPARTPKKENARFFRDAAAAEAAGFRPCRRCRPETAPGSPAWNGTSTSVSRGLKLIESGFLDEHSVEQLATLLGMGERHMRRLFLEHVGAAPNAIARSRRAHFAARMLRDTALPLSQVAHSAGFGSIRQFNDVFRLVFGEPPSAVRSTLAAQPPRRQPRGAARSITVALPYRPPYPWDALLAFLKTRAVRGVEEVNDATYRRSISIGDCVGLLEVRPGARGRNELSVSVTGIEPALLGKAVRQTRRMFDCDADPLAIAERLKSNSRLAPLVKAAPGMRIPATWDAFEAAVRAVLGQQINVAGAITIAGRLAERCGTPLEGGGTITRAFPGAAAVAAADLSTLGVPAARARTLRDLARAVLKGSVRLDGFAPLDQLEASLQSIGGIGPWSARYIELRGLGEPDAFLETDLGIRKALDALGFPRNREKRREALERLSPWRGYAALYLWSAAAAGG